MIELTSRRARASMMIAWTIGLHGCAVSVEDGDANEYSIDTAMLPVAADLEYCVSGIISYNGTPVAGASARLKAVDFDGKVLYGYEGQSASNGHYMSCFSYNPGNTAIYITATYNGTSDTKSVSSLPGTYNFALIPSPPKLFGNIWVNGNSAPYHTSISYHKSDNSASGWMQTTDDWGTYGNSSVPSGTYVVTATVYTQPTTSSMTSTVNIANGDVPTNFYFNISGYQKGRISGNVTLDGYPTSNQIVYLRPNPANGMDQVWTVTNTSGTYATPYVPAGQYTAQVTVNNMTQSKNITIGSGLTNVGFMFVTPVPPVPCCTGSCFVAGTPVSLADGTTRPIDELQVGDLVLAYDTDAKRLTASPVTHKFVHPNSEGLVVINGHLRATVNHPFYANGQWVRADELNANDSLVLLPEGTTALSAGDVTGITPVESLAFEPERTTTYNIEVADQHTYFADGLLVHNKAVCQLCD